MSGTPTRRRGGGRGTVTRAWDLRVGDVLTPIGLSITAVKVDGPGAGDRVVHVQHELGSLDIPINQTVRLSNTRETGLWD